ncbi:MAG: hypothetical protein IPK82_29255 [Polyangiaceae bacterium]|nr:hypothetical protein [Polyangiaceae bacterium]
MQTRHIALIGALTGGLVIALLGGFGRFGTSGTEQQGSPPSATDQRRGADRPAAPGQPLRAEIAAAPAAEIPDLVARDQRRRDAIGSFGFSLLGALDVCIAAGPGPRVPQRLLLHFERAKESAPGQETFELKSVAPADMRPDQPDLRGTPIGTCLSGLAGRVLSIPAGPGTQESSFQEFIAIPIPASVAWAPQQIPVR